MLTLCHVPASHAGSVPPASGSAASVPEAAVHPALLTVAFGGDDGIATPVLAPSGSEQLLERWSAGAPLVATADGALTWRHDGQLLGGCVTLEESSVDDLEAVTAEAYRRIFAVLDESAFPHLWRVWNFIPHINTEAAGLERYRRFNVARQDAFALAGRDQLAAVPAASAVGSGGGGLVIYFLAGRVAPLPIENPRQLSAYHYPVEYGPRSPLFARACLAPGAGGEILFISGTASIVGHETLHIGDVRAQTRESLANIDAVLAAANESAGQRHFARGDLSYKVYVRHSADLATIRAELDAWLPGATALYLQADICRADLLVEIEASGGHAVGGRSA